MVIYFDSLTFFLTGPYRVIIFRKGNQKTGKCSTVTTETKFKTDTPVVILEQHFECNKTKECM